MFVCSHSTAIRIGHRMNSRRIISAACASMIFLYSISPAHAQTDDQLEEASRLEKSGETQSSARTYYSWLEKNASSPIAQKAFLDYLRVESDLSRILEASRRLLAAMPSPTGDDGFLRRVAEIFELSGALEEARATYR